MQGEGEPAGTGPCSGTRCFGSPRARGAPLVPRCLPPSSLAIEPSSPSLQVLVLTSPTTPTDRPVLRPDGDRAPSIHLAPSSTDVHVVWELVLAPVVVHVRLVLLPQRSLLLRFDERARSLWPHPQGEHPPLPSPRRTVYASEHLSACRSDVSSSGASDAEQDHLCAPPARRARA